MKAGRKTISIIVASLLVAGAGGWVYSDLTAPAPASPAVVSRQAIVVTPPPTPVLTPSPIPTPVPDVVISAAPPLRLQVPVIGLDGDITVYTQAMIEANGGYEPPTLESIIWDSTIEGGLAGTDATSSLFLYGHSWTDPAIFNGVRLLKVSDVAIVTTSRGRLCYVVQSTREVDKPSYKSDPELTTPVPNRLVLVSCYRPVGYDPLSHTVQNAVVILQLDQAMTNAGC